jgi:hypothetical protein
MYCKLLSWRSPCDVTIRSARGVAYAVLTAVNGGSELVIFVPRAARGQITLDDLGYDDISE